MNLSRYILKYSTDDGTLYFNTKTNHSFFLMTFQMWTRKEDIMKVKVNNKFDDKMNAKPRVFNYNCDCK